MAEGYDEELCGDHSDDDGGLSLYCEPVSILGQGAEDLCKGETRTAANPPPASGTSERDTYVSKRSKQLLRDCGVVLNSRKLKR